MGTNSRKYFHSNALLKQLVTFLIAGGIIVLVIVEIGSYRQGKIGLAALSKHLPTQVPTPTLTPVAKYSNSTPSYQPYTFLLAKIVSVGPVYVTGDKTVPNAALIAAGDYLNVMLQHRPDLAAILRDKGTFTAVSSRTETLCDLPYFTSSDVSNCSKYGYGGAAGGVLSHPITACNERNLLKESDDMYGRGSSVISQNICVHELAHTIMNVGLSENDLRKINARFGAALQEGLWSGDYAMTNSGEFWAVMSQFYFSAGPNITYPPTFNHSANSPDALKYYDIQTFILLDSIYQGSANLS